MGLSYSVSLDMNVNVTGFPGDKAKTMWKSQGKILNIITNDITSDSERVIRYDNDTMPGSSGSPIYNSSNQLVGIHSAGGSSSNSGVGLTNYLYKYFHSAKVQYGKASPGHLDKVSTSNIGGWAIDSSDPYDQKDVHVYVRNNTTNELVKSGSVKANLFREDVGLHAFNYSISWLKIKPGKYRVDTYAIGINDSNPALNNSGLVYTVEQSTGVVDSVTASGGIRGWVWKPDAPNDSINAHIYIYDSSNNKVLGKSVSASNYRSDLVNAGIGNGYHGFSYIVDWESLPSETLTVKVYAVDGSGTNTQIYSKTYNNY